VDDRLLHEGQAPNTIAGKTFPPGSNQTTGLSTLSRRPLLRQRNVPWPGDASWLAYLPETRKRLYLSCSR
jgi:hypothetical protein